MTVKISSSLFGSYGYAGYAAVAAWTPPSTRRARYRRRPERTPLYRAVQGHLETYLALAREGHNDGGGVPQYVEGEFRRYLEGGILAHGFARAHCWECGHDFLIAFSCKGRALCPFVQRTAHGANRRASG